ncbi:MAG: hypothetical protein QOE97_1415, partial [Pseudonocardiales bacterium]|nr:hypothetical protein [Pseudonocardiales bacterium]
MSVRSRTAGHVRRVLVPPAVAWLAALAVFAVRSGGGLHLFRVRTWARWDSTWYLTIAQHGYSAKWHCGGHSIPPHLKPGNYLCGTVQWFAGYPAAIRGLSEITRLSVPVAALALSWICWYIYLVAGWQLLEDSVSRTTRWLCLGLLAFAPGAVYFPAIFPISLTMAGMLACLYFVWRSTSRWAPVGAFAAGIAAGSGYISAVVLCPALILAVAVSERARWRACIAGAAGVAAGFAALVLAAQLYTGIWDGYFIAQSKYATGTHNPISRFGQHLRPLWDGASLHRPVERAAAEQTAYTAAILVLAAAVLAMLVLRGARIAASERRDGSAHTRMPGWSQLVRSLPALDVTALAAASAAWLIAYGAGARISVWRSEAFAVLAVLLLRHLRWPALVVPLAAAAYVASNLAIYFFNGQL